MWNSAHAPTSKTVDHVLPTSRGGKNERGNIVSACGKCNQDKNNMTLEEFRMVTALRRGIIKPIGKDVCPFYGEENYRSEFSTLGDALDTAMKNHFDDFSKDTKLLTELL
jgi:hypothetical protein